MDPKDKAPPAMWEHCSRVYAEMEKTSQAETRTASDMKSSLWEGFTSKLFAALGIAVPYYGKVLTILVHMGCIEQIRRGGGTSPSQWRLWKTPTLEDFERVRVLDSPKLSEAPLVDQQVADIRKQLGGVDVPRALADLAAEISALKEVSHHHGEK